MKLVLFHFKQMFRRGFPPAYYVQYCKNRFFWRFLVSGVPRFDRVPADDFEVRVLCQKRDVWMLVWALASFLHHSKLSPRIVVHDDGSFDDASVAILKSIFPQIVILFKKDADRMIAEQSGIPQVVRDYRNLKNKLSLKLADIFLLSTAEKVMVLDSDILFYDTPQEIIDFVSGKSNADALISWSPLDFSLTVKKEYFERHNLHAKDVEHMNSGLIIYNKNAISLESFLDYFENISNIENYFSEMSGWCALIAQTHFAFLTPEKYIVKGGITPGVVTKHFTSPRRFEMFAYGIDEARKNLSKQ